MIDTFWGHQVISRQAYDTYLMQCQIDDDDFSLDDDGFNAAEAEEFGDSRRLSGCYSSVWTVMQEAGSLSPYGMII